MKKRLVAVTMAAAMSAALLAGCGSSGTQTQENGAAETSAQASGNGEEAAGETAASGGEPPFKDQGLDGGTKRILRGMRSYYNSGGRTGNGGNSGPDSAGAEGF